MYPLTPKGPIDEIRAFARLHTVDRSAADLGKMLDTGMILEPRGCELSSQSGSAN
jgi:hypothetical protein